MNNQDFNTTISVDNSAGEVFNAVTNVRGWWSEEITGGTAKLNDVFKYHFKDVHSCTCKLIEVIPNKKVVWEVLENNFNFIKDQTEWVGTKVIFGMSESDGTTTLHFTHKGL